MFTHPEALLSKEGRELMNSKAFQRSVVADPFRAAIFLSREKPWERGWAESQGPSSRNDALATRLEVPLMAVFVCC